MFHLPTMKRDDSFNQRSMFLLYAKNILFLEGNTKSKITDIQDQRFL